MSHFAAPVARKAQILIKREPMPTWPGKKDDRTLFEARKKGYEKEEQQKRQTLRPEKSQAKPEQGETSNIK